MEMSSIKWIALCVAGLFMLVAAPAQASRDVYPVKPQQRGLDSGLAGWQGSSKVSGLCVPVVLCPTAANIYRASGGAGGGGGYIRTTVNNLGGAEASTTGTWTSPRFKYRGVDGRKPDSLALKLERRANVAGLIGVVGNQATYTVTLLDQTGDKDVRVISQSTLEGADDWAEIKPAKIDPDPVKVGRTYRIEIASEFDSGVSVLPAVTADYDRIRLSAKTRSKGGNGNGAGNGNGNGNGNGGGKRKRKWRQGSGRQAEGRDPRLRAGQGQQGPSAGALRPQGSAPLRHQGRREAEARRPRRHPNREAQSEGRQAALGAAEDQARAPG